MKRSDPYLADRAEPRQRLRPFSLRPGDGAQCLLSFSASSAILIPANPRYGSKYEERKNNLMKMIFLVDGDNNIGTGLQGIDLLTAEDTVLVFFGKGQTLGQREKAVRRHKGPGAVSGEREGRQELPGLPDHHGAGRPGGKRRGGFRLCHQPGQGI